MRRRSWGQSNFPIGKELPRTLETYNIPFWDEPHLQGDFLEGCLPGSVPTSQVRAGREESKY